MARLEGVADRRGKGESCNTKWSKGLQVGFVFGKRTQQGREALHPIVAALGQRCLGGFAVLGNDEARQSLSVSLGNAFGCAT